MSAPVLLAPVTFLDNTSRPLLVHARWGDRRDGDRHSLYHHGAAGYVFLAYVMIADEGMTWVRGHVSEEDESGRALLAYGALTTTPREQQEFLMHTFEGLLRRPIR